MPDTAQVAAIPVVTPEEMAAIDKAAIAELSHEHSKPLEVLISRAGEAVAAKARQMLVERSGQCYGQRVLVLAGKGNNGKDGKEAARRLRSWGVQVLVVDMANRHIDNTEIDSHKTDTHKADSPKAEPSETDFHKVGPKEINPHEATNNDGSPFRVAPPASFAPIDLIIDAAYGTGLSRPYELPEFIRDLPKDIPVLAVDIPSGVCGLTGELLGEALPADATVTFGAYKPGLLFGEGKKLSGQVEMAGIGLDASNAKAHLFTAGSLAALLPERDANAHKWNAACWVVGGSPGMAGAPSLAASAAYRAGAGYVRVSTPAAASPDAAILPPAALSPTPDTSVTPTPEVNSQSTAEIGGDTNPASFLGVQEAVGFALPAQCWSEVVIQASSKFHSLVVGPGLSASEETRKSVQHLLASEAVTSGWLAMVIDGGALEALGQGLLETPLKTASLKAEPPKTEPLKTASLKTASLTTEPLKTVSQSDGEPTKQSGAGPQVILSPQVVLTPHDREYAYLLGSPPDADRIKASRELAAATGAVVLLKGSTTVIAHPDGSVLLSAAGDQRLATAGTGDVLAGIIGALLAQKLDAFHAAALGAELHGRAARLGSASGLLASDIGTLLPQVMQKLSKTQMI